MVIFFVVLGRIQMTKKKDSDDILKRLLARQEDSEGNTKLREFLNNLNEDGTTDESYQDTPMYKMGYEDGEIAGFEIASQRFQDELRSLKTIINAMIESK